MIRSISALLAAVAVATAAAGAATPRPSKPATPPPVAAPPVSAGPSFDLGVWTVHATSVDANFKSGDFSTPEKVVMTRVGGDVTADKANGNYKKQIVYLVGNVVMHDSSGNYGGVASAGGEHNNAPSTLTADKAEIDGSAKIYKATGNVHYVQADTIVDAETGTLNDTTHDLYLQGNVRIVQGSRRVNAQSVVYNTISGRAHAEGDVTMQFPGEIHRGLATPKPIHIPKNPVTKPAASASP